LEHRFHRSTTALELTDSADRTGTKSNLKVTRLQSNDFPSRPSSRPNPSS